MAKDRLLLHEELVVLLGSRNVYFQPPADLDMGYPCYVYKLDAIDTSVANNKKYLKMNRYLITAIDEDPDTILHQKVLDMPLSAFETHFVSDNLNHYICSLYY